MTLSGHPTNIVHTFVAELSLLYVHTWGGAAAVEAAFNVYLRAGSGPGQGGGAARRPSGGGAV